MNIKTYLRSTTGQERLNSQLLSNLNPDLLDSIRPQDVAKEFTMLHSDRSD